MQSLRKVTNQTLLYSNYPPVETATERVEWQDYRSVGPLTKGSVIEFNIPGTSSDYIDLKRTRLYVSIQILNPAGEPVTAKDLVAPVNLTMHSLFKQVDVSLQQQLITTTVGANYPYKAMFDTLLKFEEDPKETQLQSQLYYKDSAGFMNDSNPDVGGNVGLVQRWALTNRGRSVDMEGPLHVDVCQQDRLILNGVQISFKLYPSGDKFTLMASEGDYQMTIRNAVLRVCHVKVNPGVLVGHAEALTNANALYPMTKSDMKTYTVAAGSYDWAADDLHQGQVPSRVVVALTSASGFNGDLKQNPYNFTHFNCSSIGFHVNGQSVPTQPFQPDFSTKNYIPAYLSLFTGIGRYQVNEGNYISRGEYPNGYCMYVFDIDGKHGTEFVNLNKKGHTRLSIKFSSALPEPATVLIYSHFPGMMMIDQARNVII